MSWPSPYLLLVLTSLFWSGNFVLGRAVHGVIPPLALSFWRWALALLILLPFAWRHLHRDWTLVCRSWPVLLGLAVLGVSNFNTFVYVGLQTTTASNAVLLVATTPVFIIALSLLLGHRLSWVQAIGILVSLTGVAVIVAKGEPQRLLQLRLNPGDLWVLGAALSWALYSVALRWRPRGLHDLSFLGATIGLGLLPLLPPYAWELAQGYRFDPNPVTGAALGYVAVFPSVLAYVFWNRAVHEVGSALSGQFIHLMPVFGTLLSVLLLDERLYGFHLLGIVLVAAGIALATGRRSGSLRLHSRSSNP